MRIKSATTCTSALRTSPKPAASANAIYLLNGKKMDIQQNMQRFEAAMQEAFDYTPERNPFAEVVPHAEEAYQFGRDCDRFMGWCLATQKLNAKHVGTVRYLPVVYVPTVDWEDGAPKVGTKLYVAPQDVARAPDYVDELPTADKLICGDLTSPDAVRDLAAICDRTDWVHKRHALVDKDGVFRMRTADALRVYSMLAAHAAQGGRDA
jgi:hypothetical protein